MTAQRRKRIRRDYPVYFSLDARNVISDIKCIATYCYFRMRIKATIMKNLLTPACLFVVTTVAVVSFIAPTVSGQEQRPKPGPEHKWMDYFVGRWTGEADVKASPFGPAGKFTYTEDVEWFPGGFFQVMHWEEKGPNGEAKGLTVMGYNAEEKVYFSRTFDGSRGTVSSGKGMVEGDTLTLTNPEFKKDGKLTKTRYVGKKLSPTSWAFKVEFSTEGGPWSIMMEGKATKTP